MTPAIHCLQKLGMPFTLHSYTHQPDVGSYGVEAAQALGLPAIQVFKTLLVMLDNDPKRVVVAIIPVAKLLDMKALAPLCFAKKAEMADPKLAQKLTGYLLGGISPLGQKKQLPTFLDQSSSAFATIFVSGGRRGLEIELSPQSLLQACSAQLVDIGR